MVPEVIIMFAEDYTLSGNFHSPLLVIFLLLRRFIEKTEETATFALKMQIIRFN